LSHSQHRVNTGETEEGEVPEQHHSDHTVHETDKRRESIVGADIQEQIIPRKRQVKWPAACQKAAKSNFDVLGTVPGNYLVVLFY
jgi:hypothetical protein